MFWLAGKMASRHEPNGRVLSLSSIKLKTINCENYRRDCSSIVSEPRLNGTKAAAVRRRAGLDDGADRRAARRKRRRAASRQLRSSAPGAGTLT